jgi:hypothetical protein
MFYEEIDVTLSVRRYTENGAVRNYGYIKRIV